MAENTDNGKLNGVVFLDIKTAFDSINHVILINKMNENFGIIGMELNWFKSYLTNREQQCIINGQLSSKKISTQVRTWLIKNKFEMHPFKSKLFFIGSSCNLNNKISEQPVEINNQSISRTSAH